jgi:hypothetical protein
VFALFTAGKLRPPPTSFYPLRDYARALADLGQRQLSGRAILIPEML